MARYNIDNEKANIAYCKNCGHEIDVTNILYIMTPPGMDVWNSLRVCNRYVECCDKPDYDHIMD